MRLEPLTMDSSSAQLAQLLLPLHIAGGGSSDACCILDVGCGSGSLTGPHLAPLFLTASLEGEKIAADEAELRNSIKNLVRSNDELKEFAAAAETKEEAREMLSYVDENIAVIAKKEKGVEYCEELRLELGRKFYSSEVADAKGGMYGCDGSGEMCELARRSGWYSEVQETESFLDFLKGRGALSADIIFSAGAAVSSIGKLDEWFELCCGALKKGGLLGFSIASLEAEEDFALTAASTETGRKENRYAHRAPYVERLAADSGFEVASRSTSPGKELFVLKKTA